MADKETRFVMRDEGGFTLVSQAMDTAVRARRTELSTSATAIPSSNLTDRKVIFVKNSNANSTDEIWIGGSDVNTTDKGFRLRQYQTIRLELTDDETVYAIKSGSGTIYAETLELA